MRVTTKARPAAVMAASAASLGVAAPSFAAQAAARTADRSGTPGGGTAVSRIAGLDYFTAAIAAATFQGGQTATSLLAHATWAAPPGAEAVVGASGTAEVSGGPSAVSRPR
jgi:hypothetical protein